jgi:hypothetical protein
VARCRWEVNINAWSEKCGLLLVSAASEWGATEGVLEHEGKVSVFTKAVDFFSSWQTSSFTRKYLTWD